MAQLWHASARAALIYQHAVNYRDRDIARALDQIGRHAGEDAREGRAIEP